MKIGDPATMCHINDRYGGKIIDIRHNGRTVDFQGDNGLIRTFTIRKNGRYVPKGVGLHDYPSLAIGFSRSYETPEI